MDVRSKETVEWMTQAVTLASVAGLGPVSDRDVDLLLLYCQQGYSVAKAVKSVFSVRWARMKLDGKVGAGDALSRN